MGMAGKNIGFSQGNRPFARAHMHFLAGVFRRKMFLEKGAELARVSKAFQKIAVFINDLNRELDAAVKGFYYIMKGIFINYGI